MRTSHAIAVTLCAICSVASAEPLSGRVLDSQLGTPVESATVLVAGPTGVQRTLTTDAAGRYQTDVAPGSYVVVFVYGSARSSGRVTVGDRGASLDGKVDSLEGETIVIKDRLRPPVPPKATNFQPTKAPPYSDKAVQQDAWTRAWLLLDIDETGKLLRIKWLKKPGYDLERIAISEIKKLAFAPARDESGKPIRAFIVWGIEWPSAGWLEKLVGTRSTMPGVKGFPPRRLDAYIPCKGTAPWHMDSVHKTYKDCSKPDFKVAQTAPWFVP